MFGCKVLNGGQNWSGSVVNFNVFVGDVFYVMCIGVVLDIFGEFCQGFFGYFFNGGLIFCR